MNNYFKIALFVLFILSIGFLMQRSAVRQFSWNPTFNKYDRQPFGMYVFDDVLSTSCPEGYQVISEGIYEYTIQKDTVSETSFLLIAQSLHQEMSDPDIEYLLKAVSAGNKAMLVSNSYPFVLEDTLKTEVSMPYLYLYDLPRRVTEGMKRDTFSVAEREFYFYEAFTGASLRPWQKKLSLEEEINPEKRRTSPFPADTIATNPLNQPIVQRYKIGKGELYLVCNPLLFTNYGMLDGENAEYIFTLLEPLKAYPIIRLERSSRSTGETSPLRYILSQPALKYSYYLTLATLLLFMIFTARRKQRIIPVITSPPNKTVEFVDLIGTLYYLRKDYTALVIRKSIYFATLLKENLYIDTETRQVTHELSSRIAEKTGLEEPETYNLLKEIEQLRDRQEAISEERMKELIGRMNRIIEKTL